LCPIRFVAGEFWKPASDYSLTVQNTSGKGIKSFSLMFEHFTGPQLLHHPFVDSWASHEPLAAGQQGTLTMKAYPGNGGQSILGWALMPARVTFDDGTTWAPKERGQCFGAFWRDAQHPDLKVLPPEQVETNSD
jgi:hypothetical protein